MPEVLTPFDPKHGDRPSRRMREDSRPASPGTKKPIESERSAPRSVWAILGRGMRNRCPAGTFNVERTQHAAIGGGRNADALPATHAAPANEQARKG